MNLPEACHNFFKEHAKRLPPPPFKALVGVSGGADSTALLHVLLGQKEKLGLKLAVAHLNHLIRGAEAEEDAHFVKEMCASIQVPCYLETVDVPALATLHGISLEEAGRQARYGFFARLMQENGLNLLLLAHTASDQAETVLMRLLRGTGLHGLTGIPAISRLPYQKDSTLVMGRPLLDVWRSDIEQYCQENNLKFRSDSTNTSLDYLRNRVRLELLPLLEEKYQKGTAENLVRLAYIASAEERWLTELTATAFTELSEIFTDSILLDINKLLSHPAALQRRLVRLAFEKLTGDTTDLTANHVELILQNLTRPVWRMNLPQELIIQVYNGRLQVSLTGAAGPFYPVLQTTEEKVLEPGKIANFGNWQLKFEEFVPPYPFEENPLVQYLDGEKINYNLLVRIRKPGEKFWPLGAPGHRKLQDFMVDRKIPRQYRDNWPLIIARYPTSEQVVWVVGQAISEEFKITAETRRVLRFEVILSLL